MLPNVFCLFPDEKRKNDEIDGALHARYALYDANVPIYASYHEPRRVPRGSGRQTVPFEQHHVRDAQLGQVIRHLRGISAISVKEA
jgi:hypothetical protein